LVAEGGAGERLCDGVGIGDEGKEDKGEVEGEAMSSSGIGGSSASAATAASMSTLKSKAGLAGVVQEENTTPEPCMSECKSWGLAV
jgi:hypothetical protein